MCSIKINKFESWKVKRKSKAGQLSKIDLYCMTNNSNKMGNIFVYPFLLSNGNRILVVANILLTLSALTNVGCG